MGKKNMLNHTDVPCAAISLALCLKNKKKIRHWNKEWYKRKPQYNTHTHTNIVVE
jgi:hypothetical protein